MKYAIALVGFLAIAALVTAASNNNLADDMLTAYYKIQKSYAADSTAGVSEAAGALAKAADETSKTETNADIAARVKTIRDEANTLKSAANLEKGRETFKDLSKNMAQLQNLTGNKKPTVFYCGMAKAYWLQPDVKTANPYYGKDMLTCGTKVDASTVK